MEDEYPNPICSNVSTKSLKYNIKTSYFSTDINSAEKILEKIREKYPVLLLGDSSWECKVFLPTGTVVTSGSHESLSLAICKAALLTITAEEKQKKIEEIGNKKKFRIFFSGSYKHAKKR